MFGNRYSSLYKNINLLYVLIRLTAYGQTSLKRQIEHLEGTVCIVYKNGYKIVCLILKELFLRVLN